jgi:hypothetical protein
MVFSALPPSAQRRDLFRRRERIDVALPCPGDRAQDDGADVGRAEAAELVAALIGARKFERAVHRGAAGGEQGGARRACLNLAAVRFASSWQGPWWVR